MKYKIRLLSLVVMTATLGVVIVTRPINAQTLATPCPATTDKYAKYIYDGGNCTMGTGISIGTLSNYDTTLLANGRAVGVIKRDGRFGIGTTDPRVLLDVRGQVELGNREASNSSGYQALLLNELIQDTNPSSPDPRYAGWIYGQHTQLTVNPDAGEVGSERAFWAGMFDAEVKDGNAQNIKSRLIAVQAQADYRGAAGGRIKKVYGVSGSASNRGAHGTIEVASGGVFQTYISNNTTGGEPSTGKIENGYGIQVLANIETGSQGKIQKMAGIAAYDMHYAENYTHILLGTKDIPSGQYAIYSQSDKPSYMAGDLSIQKLSGRGTRLVVASPQGTLQTHYLDVPTLLKRIDDLEREVAELKK